MYSLNVGIKKNFRKKIKIEPAIYFDIFFNPKEKFRPILDID